MRVSPAMAIASLTCVTSLIGLSAILAGCPG